MGNSQWKTQKKLYSCQLVLFSHCKLGMFLLFNLIHVCLDMAPEGGMMFNVHCHERSAEVTPEAGKAAAVLSSRYSQTYCLWSPQHYRVVCSVARRKRWSLAVPWCLFITPHCAWGVIRQYVFHWHFTVQNFITCFLLSKKRLGKQLFSCNYNVRLFNPSKAV